MHVFGFFAAASCLSVALQQESQFVQQGNSSSLFGQQFAYCKAQQFLFVSDPTYVHVKDGINYSGAVFVYRWIIYEQRFELLTVVTLEGTAFANSLNFGTDFSVSEDCRSLYVGFGDGVLAMYQTEYNTYTMKGIEIHQNQSNFGVNVWYDDITDVLVASDTSRIYTCTSTNYDWRVTETAQCTDGISHIATRNGFAYYLCNNEAKLQSIDIAKNQPSRSWDVLQNAVFTVSPDVIVVATNRQVRLIGENEATISWEGGSAMEVSYNNNIVAIRDNNTVIFLQIDDNDLVDKWSITPCGSGVNLAQFVGDGVYMVSCRNENIIRVWSVSDTVSQRQVNTAATAVLTAFACLVLTVSAGYLIWMDERRHRQTRRREYVERLRSMQGELLFLG